MKKNDKIEILTLELEEAIQMLRLVSENKRTCLEVKEWLEQNYPEIEQENEVLSLLANNKV